MAASEAPRRRFAPDHIETTFEYVRFPKRPQDQQQQQRGRGQPGGPNPELTPEPSPREPSPVPPQLREKRRFAPQLVESSRRTRRVGDVGPATRPTDKTDITPYTNHIYIHRSRSRRRPEDDHSPARQVRPPTRRESEDEETKGYLLDLAAREAERQIQESALAAFPNSRAREGGVAHFFFRESSGDDTTPESVSPVTGGGAPQQHPYHPRVLRRKSSDLGWWHKTMQEHAEKLAAERGEKLATAAAADDDDDEGFHTSDSELDHVELGPPENLDWFNKKSTGHRSDTRGSMPGPGQRGPIGEFVMPLVEPDPWVTSDYNYYTPQMPASRGSGPAPIGESYMPFIPSAPPGRAADMDYRPAAVSNIPADTGFRNGGFGGFGGGFGGGFSKPFGGGMGDRDQLRNMRNAASPPMLGKDLDFRMCQSPKHTKLETDHRFKDVEAELGHRDATGGGGLWNGYCFKGSDNEDNLAPSGLHPIPMIHTPNPAKSPGSDLFAAAFSKSVSITDEPGTVSPTGSAGSGSATPTPGRLHLPNKPHAVSGGNREPRGVQMLLPGIDERLRREKATLERNEKIAAEFNDEFITQVYNYLSLGYPSLAHAFDEELSKISRISIEELVSRDGEVGAQGHMIEKSFEGTPEEKRCPRWRALKSYIIEWARQHPDLDSMDPLAWGVRERRGSWAF